MARTSVLPESLSVGALPALLQTRTPAHFRLIFTTGIGPKRLNEGDILTGCGFCSWRGFFATASAPLLRYVGRWRSPIGGTS